MARLLICNQGMGVQVPLAARLFVSVQLNSPPVVGWQNKITRMKSGIDDEKHWLQIKNGCQGTW